MKFADVIGPMFDELAETPYCFGCTFDDFLEALGDGRVTAFRINNAPATNVCTIYDPREDNDND